MAATAQPSGLQSIPQLAKGAAGNGFNLRAAMELEDDSILYGTVHVSQSLFIIISIFFMIHAQHCVQSLADRAGLDYMVCWHGQSKETVGK